MKEKDRIELELYNKCLKFERKRRILNVVSVLLVIVVVVVLTIALVKTGEDIDNRCVYENNIKTN